MQATETAAGTVRIPCSHCHAINRVQPDRAGDAPVCGACRQPLFEGKPYAIEAARFDRELANTDVPVVVDFWAPWCGPCRHMAPVFERAAAEIEPRARFVKVNTDEAQDLAERLGIRGIPTIGVFRDGREVARTSGAMDVRSFLDWLRPHL
jgi:thioredoxin 2